MIKSFIKLLVFLSLLFGTDSFTFAQTTVQIGSGTNTPSSTLYSPIYRFSATSTTSGARSNLLYTAAELQAAGIFAGKTISAIAFHKTNDANFVTPASYTIYMANTSNSPPLATSTLWADIMTSHSQVFQSTSFNIDSLAGWVTIELDAPFVYNGGALEIATELSMTGNGGATDKFQWEFTDGFEDQIIGVSNLTSTTLNGTVSGYKERPNIRFTLQPSGANDAGVPELIAPINFCAGIDTIKIKVQNMGVNVIDSVEVAWQLDGVPQTPILITTPLDTAGGTGINELELVLGAYTFTSDAVDLKAWTYLPNGVADTSNLNDTLEVVLKASMSGTYTVNSANPTSGTNYQSFEDLTNDLNTFGICGPVVVDVVAGSGPYVETIHFEDISGTSAINTIRINGNGATVQFANTSGDRQLLTLNGTKYLTVDSLTFKTLDVDYGWGAWITNGAAYDSIINCHFDMTSITNTSTTESNGIVLSGSSTSATSTGANGSHIYLAHNHIQGVAGSGGPYYAISIAGDCDSNIVFNNLIEDFYSYGIRLTGGVGNLIDGNEITRHNKTSTTTMYGIYHGTGASEHTVIRNNRIHTPGGVSGGTSAFYGIALYADPVNSSTLVYNNLVYNINQGGLSRGVYISTADSVKLYHNTIVFDQPINSSSANYGIYASGTSDGNEIINNNVAMTDGGTGTKYGFYYSSSGSISDAQRNNFYLDTAMSGTVNYGYYTSAYTDQAAFQTAYPTLEVGSPADDPMFLNPLGGDFTPVNPIVAAAGENLSAIVPEDINGVSRPSAPTPGAFQAGTAPSNDAAATALVAPVSFCAGAQDIEITIANFGATIIATLEVHWMMDGVPQTPVSITTPLDTLGGNGLSEQNIVLGNYTFTGDAVDLKAWTYLPNGVADTSNLNDTLEVVLKASMSGTYTLNSANPTGGTNYQSFEDLTNDLNTFGVCGPVSVDVVSGSGPYVETIHFEDIVGTSATNTIRINGNGATVQFTNTSGDRHMLMLNGTKYLTVDSLTFKTLDADYGWGAWITNGAAYDSIINCHFDMTSITGTSSAQSSGIVLSGSPTSATSTGANGSHIYLAHNHIQGVAGSGGPYYAISIAGDCDSNIVFNNLIEDFYYYGIRLTGGVGNLIDGNEITRHNKTSTTIMYGIYHGTGASEHTIIRNNRIHTPGGVSGGTSTFYGIALLADPVTSSTLVYNNLVYNINQGGLSRGVYISTADSVKLYHNTIVFDQPINSSSTNYGIYATGTSDGNEIINNNVAMTDGGTGTKYGFYYSSSGSISDAQRNNFYLDTAMQGTVNYGYYTSAYADQAAFQTAYPTLELGSPADDPMFGLIANNDYTPFNPALISGGQNLNALVPEDINGLSRAANPTIGAYEAEPLEDDDAGVDSLIGPADSLFCSNVPVEITVRIMNYGQNTIDSVMVHWMADGVVQTPVAYNTTPLLNAGNPTDNYADVVLGTYEFTYRQPVTFKVWTADPNGLLDGDVANDTLEFVRHSAMEGVNANITSTSASICDGASITLDAGDQPPGALFFWNTGDLTQTTTVDQEGVYYVWVQSIQGCEGSDTLVVGALSSPVANSISVVEEGGGSYTFSVIGANFVDSMSWDFGDGSAPVSGAGPHQHTYDTGVYTITLRLFNSCGEFVITRDVDVRTPTDIKDMDRLDRAITLYPNPTRAQFELKVDGNIRLRAMNVVNVLGQVVRSEQSVQPGVPYSLRGLASGVYQVVIETDAGKVVKKLELIK